MVGCRLEFWKKWRFLPLCKIIIPAYISGRYSHNPYFRWKIMADDISIGEAQ